VNTHGIIADFLRTHFSGVRRGVEPDQPLFSSGVIDSFGVLELIAFVEEAFHITIDPARHDLIEFDTINKIAALVEHGRPRE
jgi:acyl carrier protein